VWRNIRGTHQEGNLKQDMGKVSEGRQYFRTPPIFYPKTKGGMIPRGAVSIPVVGPKNHGGGPDRRWPKSHAGVLGDQQTSKPAGPTALTRNKYGWITKGGQLGNWEFANRQTLGEELSPGALVGLK